MKRLFGEFQKESSDGGTAEDLDPKSIGPYVLYDGTGDSSTGVDIVFVHGLRGSAYRTWSKGDICWPRDLLRNDIPRARVITWGYDSGVARFFTYASRESIFGHADTLLGDLARLRQDITRPIIFVAHSLGGLVVKAALIKSDGYNNHNRHASQADIYASTSGVAFFGTPHRGSSKECYGEIIAGIAKFCLRQPNKSLLETLKEDSHILEGQRDAWTTISNNMQVICVREELPTAIGMIVPEASASYDGFNVQRSSINANHSDMVKFDDEEDPMYKRAAGLLVDLAKTSVAAEEDHMKTQLKVLSFSGFEDRELHVEAAHESTFQWITSQDTILTDTDAMNFVSWIDSSHHGLFLSGKAASGKSTLMKYLTETQMSLLKNSDWTSHPSSVVSAAFFFHERGSDLQKSREGMLRTLLYQILEQVPMRLFDDNFYPKWHSLTPVLRKAITNLGARGKNLFLFLDGLDEFRMMEKIDDYTEEQKDLIYDGGDNDAAWGVSEWIVEGHREIANFILELCSKRNVRVCFSCRELSVFEGKFRGLPRLQLHRYTRNDIYRYSHGRLSTEVPGLHDIDKFASSITDRASGVFLWVKLVVNMLIDGYDAGDNVQELWRTLEHLPDRLGGKIGLYMSMLRHIRNDYRAESARLFRLVEHAEEQLHLLQLSFAAESLAEIQANGYGSCVQIDQIGQSGFSTLCETHLRRLKSRCGGLLEADPFVNFMHQTAKEFMQRQFAKKTVFGGEPEFTEVNLSSALLEGCMILFQVVERLQPTDTSDILWKEPNEPIIPIGNGVFRHIAVLDHSCIDTESYISLVDRINGTEVPRQPLFALKGPPSFHPEGLKVFLRGPWFAHAKTRTHMNEFYWTTKSTDDFMLFAARTNLSKYIDFSLGHQIQSPHVDEACRLWVSGFPFGQGLEWDSTRATSKAFTVSESGIGIDTCRTLLTHVAQSDNGTTTAMELVLHTWACALFIGCEYFTRDDNIYGKDWPELILLMLIFGVPVNTPVRLVSNYFVTIVTLPSSEVLLGILELSKANLVRNTTLRDLEAEVLEWLPKNLTSPPIFKHLIELEDRPNSEDIANVDISVELCSDAWS